MQPNIPTFHTQTNSNRLLGRVKLRHIPEIFALTIDGSDLLGFLSQTILNRLPGRVKLRHLFGLLNVSFFDFQRATLNLFKVFKV